MWVCSMTSEYVNYIMWVFRNNVRILLLLFCTLMLTFEIFWMGLYSWHYSQGSLIVHPSISQKKQCSS
jgi:hypothetical protein